MKRTKIVCTIGPSTDTPGILEKMLEAGMNVARFNFSHGSYEEHKKRIEAVRAASKRTGIPVALMLDTKGPEIRLGLFKEGKIVLHAGQKFTLTTRNIEGDETICHVNHPGLPNDVAVGKEILLSDGLVTLKVDSIEGTEIHTTVLNSGSMSDRKRVAVPGMHITLPPVSEQDEADLRFGAHMGMDYVAASFMQRGSDVVAIRRILESEGSNIQIISKIENQEGLDNLDDILAMSDGLMVARGDLGVEVPAEEVPVLQKMMIAKCNQLAKPVITATQMLESMTQNPRPTRAEASDVANAILDGTDAVMLSGETASGKYPVEAVQTMTRVAEVTEASSLYRNARHAISINGAHTSEAISQATITLAESLGAAAIITSTASGKTAMNVSRNRPNCKIIAITPSEETARKTLLYWGVENALSPNYENSDEMVQSSIAISLEQGFINSGDLVVVTAGVPSGKSGTTNMIRVHIAAKILIRGNGVGQQSATGRVCLANSGAKASIDFKEGDILVVDSLESDLMPYAQKACAIISGEDGYTSTTAIAGINFGIPVVLGATDAFKVLQTGDIVTVDGARGKVFEGEVNAR